MSRADWKMVFNRKPVGVYLGQFAVTSTLWFFLTWFPNYLTQEKHIAALTAGFMTTVPFLAAFFGVILSGYFADRMVCAGKSLGLPVSRSSRRREVEVGLDTGLELKPVLLPA